MASHSMLADPWPEIFYPALPDATEETEERFRKLVKQACREDTVQAIQEALTLASESEFHADMRLIMKLCLCRAIKCRSLRVLVYLLNNGAEIHTVTPESLVLNFDDELDDDYPLDDEDEGAASKCSPPPIDLLRTLLDHGWDINSMALPQYNMYPLLWYLCPWPESVQWCLDHGASVIVPGETTSIYPTDDISEIFHTRRHALLLENAAAFSDIATFELLRSRGAPLTPGKTWPPWHAPCLLMRAVEEACRLAPLPHEKSTDEFQTRVSMIRHILKTTGVSADDSGHHDPSSTILEPRSHVMFSHVKGDKQNLEDVVRLLLDAGADVGSITESHMGSGKLPRKYTPLLFMKTKYPKSFELALRNWQQHHLETRHTECGPSKSAGKITNYDLRPTSNVRHLDNLPTEIISSIAFRLDLADIQSFRLVNRAISVCSFEAFKVQIRHRKVSLELDLLTTLVEEFVGMEGHLIHYVEEFTITQGEVDHKGKEHLLKDLLTKLFVAAKAKGKLRSLILRSWSVSFIIFFHAVQESGLVLTKLNLFPDGGYGGSSIHLCHPISQLEDISLSLSTLKHFTWSLRSTAASLGDEDLSLGVIGLKIILRMMPWLNSIEIGWFRSPPRTEEAMFVDSCIESLLDMTQLKELTLRGMFLHESALYKLLSHTSAIKITLRYINIRPIGAVKSILEVLTGGRFQCFHLDDLHEESLTLGQYRLVHFNIPGSLKFPMLYGGIGPSEVVREGNEGKRRIEYSFSRGRPMGGSDAMRYYKSTKSLYGYDRG